MAPICLSLHSSISMEFTTFHSKYLKRPTVIALKGPCQWFWILQPILPQFMLLLTFCLEL